MTYKISTKISFLLCFTALALYGCGKNITPTSETYASGKSVALMWEAPGDSAQIITADGGGLIGAAIALASKEKVGYYDALETVKVQPIAENHYLNPFGDTLKEKGMDTHLVLLPTDRHALREKAQADRKKAPYDFTFLKSEKNIDYVMYLDIKTFGVIRNSSYGINVSKPVPRTLFNLYLIDTLDNTIVGRYRFNFSKTLEKDWKEKDYEALKQAVSDSLIKGLKDAYFGFFDEN